MLFPPANGRTFLIRVIVFRFCLTCLFLSGCTSNQVVDPGYPQRKFLLGDTEEPGYSSYVKEFVKKIESTFYSNDIRKAHLSGELVVDVAINKNGTINEINIRRSSGENVLDRITVKLIEKSAPFDPLPVNWVEEVDILHITQKFRFISHTLAF